MEEAVQLNVIPKPNEVIQNNGPVKFNSNMELTVNNPKLHPVANLFIEEVSGLLDVKLSDNKKALISLELTPGADNDESYQLQTKKKKILIKAQSVHGIFNGLQTLRQMLVLDENSGNEIVLPAITINDSPRFGWRGLMLDESRHFFGAERVKELLDLMAVHKLNIFHWHLTDVSGWRIEIKKYPKLAEIGGKGNHIDSDAPVRYYTQEQIREIVEYAAERCIEIIPEIDMPGHAAAANRAYPEFSGGGSKSYPEFTFNPGKKETYAYLTNILREVAQLFPSKYIHLGGDEVHFGNENWKTDRAVQRLMKKHNLSNLNAVESYFVRRMADSIQMLGKTVVGWDEIVDHGLSPENSVVMWWRHNMPSKLEEALEKDYTVVLCPRIPLYFDFVQHESHEWGRKWDGAFASPDLVYRFPPDTLPGFKAHYDQVSGIQGNIWTERIQNKNRLDFMLNPRLSALSEAAWTRPENKDFNDFERRLKIMMKFLDEKDIYYFNPFNPESTPEPEGPKQN